MLPQKFVLIIPRKNSLMHKSNLIFFYIKFFSFVKCWTSQQLDIIKKNKEKLQKKLERHQNLFEEEKEKKRQYDRERYKNLPENKNKGWLNTEKNIT